MKTRFLIRKTKLLQSIQSKCGSKNIFATIILCAAVGLLFASGNSAAQTSPSSTNLQPELQEIVTLSRQQITDDVITNYIKSSGKTYQLSSDDIINLKQQGVSQAVITVLIQASTPGNRPSAPANTVPISQSATQSTSQSPVPPPLDATPPSAIINSPAPVMNAGVPLTTASLVVTPSVAMPALQDNFFADSRLDPTLWDLQSGALSALAALHGVQVQPLLVFSPAGMQMSGIGASGQFMGILSRASYAAPFSFSTTVSGMQQSAIPFEVYLVSDDLRQWVSIAGHLGGHGGPRGALNVGGGTRLFHGDVLIPVGGNSADYGVWLNHSGSGKPITALGNKLFETPAAGVPYTIQVSVAANGMVSVSLLDSASGRFFTREVPIGTGPFHVVLAGRNGAVSANWQSVQVLPATPPVVETPVVPATPTWDYFQAQLRPFGNWVEVPGYGLCWQPLVEAGWRPYYDGGHWEYTDAGWYWQSDYPWGDIAFHYGRWAYTASGWVWVPGYEYAPSWVVWRHADEDGYIGWAPLPPGAVFVGGGWEFNHVRVGVDFAFGLGDGFFTFVDFNHLFFDPHVYHHGYRDFVVPREHLAVIYRHSVIENRYHMDHGHFVNDGLARERMSALTHHEIRDVKPAQSLRDHEEHENAQKRIDSVRNFKPGGQEKPKTGSYAKGPEGEKKDNGR